MKVEQVSQGFVGLLYEDGAYSRVLEPGRHEFPSPWPWERQVARTVTLVDVRERSLTIKGQEMSSRRSASPRPA